MSPLDVWSLFWTQFWQVSLLLLIVGAISRFTLSKYPQVTRAIWLLALIKCVFPPVFSSPLGMFSWSQVQTSGVPLLENGSLIARCERFVDYLHASGWASSLLVVWLAGVAAYLAWVGLRWRSLQRALQRSHEPVPPAVRELVAEVQQQLGLRRVELTVTSRPLGPAALGIWRPQVILPQAVLEGKSLVELRPILTHEMLHIVRGDNYIAWLQLLVQAIWWFHPLVWWASREVSLHTEFCCDRDVVQHTACSPKEYAACLLSVLQLRCRLRPVLMMPGIHPGQMTARRLVRLLQHSPGRRTRALKWLVPMGLLLAALVVLPGKPLVVSPELFTPLFQPDYEKWKEIRCD